MGGKQSAPEGSDHHHHSHSDSKSEGSDHKSSSRSLRKSKATDSDGKHTGPHRHRYDTFPEVPAAFGDQGFKWEQEAKPWPLLGRAGVAVGKNIAALLILVWTLLTQKQYLMQCDGRELHPGMLYACEYTKAYLRAFPLLAVNVCLLVSLRMLVQQRIYYGLLKVGGLLDFTNAKAMRDPLFWALIFSLFHGFLHFCLKAAMHPGGLDDIRLWQSIMQHFLVPSFIFMVFFYQSADVEKNLIPLNKYFEEDYEYAQKALGSIVVMDEFVVRYDVLNRDVPADAEDYTIQAVYKELIDNFAKAKARTPETEFHRPFLDYQLFKAMWPANVLLDSRLYDKDSSSFRLMFCVFSMLCVITQLATLMGFGYQAYKDMVLDVYYAGQLEDITSFVVQTVHLFLIIWIFSVSLRSALLGRCCACCGYKERPDSES